MDSSLSEILPLPGGPARIEWRRSARARRVSLRIDPRDGHVVVTLPPRAARTAGMALLMDHADWVSARLAALPGAVPFADGAEVPLHGIAHRIRHDAAARTVRVAAGEILVGGAAEFLARRVADFYRGEARRQLSLLALQKAELAALRPRRVSVKDTRSRWGSCAADRSLSFSWRLVMAPAFVQDYVAAHEVAHLRHMNHGPRFWALVGQLTPHTDTAVAWLRHEGPRLLRIG
ncbi:MAG: zinc metallopeptidase [Rhodospirillales bacterium 70-18]|nr:M48 family metallopeptidase [Rhodospirillales bacterium]OJY66756.1 MAG: zinc metallopeptidase [Rhodospirillales bacterium 70-18]